jgi:antitoxin FitA
VSVVLRIRDVPEDVRDGLVESARRRGQSLQAFLLAMLRREVRFAGNLALLHGFDHRTDGVPDSASVTELLDQTRAERDAQNLGDLG